MHFHDHDEGRRLYLGKFIYLKYKEAGTRITNIMDTFTSLHMLQSVNDGTYERYLEEEKRVIADLKLEPLEEQARFTYISVLDKLWKAQGLWEEKASKQGWQLGSIITPKNPLPLDLKKALTQYNEATAEAEHFERMLGIAARWEHDSPEYLDAKKWSGERKYRLALDRLERLVIQRIFELQKANLISTAYKMREQISSHLRTRCAAIRAAIKTYNKASSDLQPQREKLDASSVLDMAFLAQFDLLRFSRPGQDIRDKPWADPGTRVLTDKYFELQRAKEEIQRLNVEWRRVRAWLMDEEKLFLRSIKCLKGTGDNLLAGILQQRWDEVRQIHRVTWHWLFKAQSLPFFSASITPAVAISKEQINQELSDTALLRDEESHDQNSNLNGSLNGIGNSAGIAQERDEDIGPDRTSHQPGCFDESREFDALLESLGSICF